MNKHFQLETVELIKEHISTRHELGIEALLGSHLKVDVYLQHIANNMVIRMDNFIAAQVLVDREVKYPATWFQHVKHDLFPKRCLKRWPVQFETERLVAKALYPDVVAMKNERHYIVTQHKKDFYVHDEY